MAKPYSEGSESIIQSEHISPDKTGDNIEAKRVVSYQFNPATAEWERSLTAGSTTARYDIQGNTIYTGEASVGTDESVAGWVITKFDLNDLTAASGKVSTDVSWLDRALGTYL